MPNETRELWQVSIDGSGKIVVVESLDVTIRSVTEALLDPDVNPEALRSKFRMHIEPVTHIALWQPDGEEEE